MFSLRTGPLALPSEPVLAIHPAQPQHMKLVYDRDDDGSSYSPANAVESYTTDPDTATAAKLVLRRMTFRGTSGDGFGGVGGQPSMR